MSGMLPFAPGELQRCLLCGVEYEPAVNAHACEIESDWTGCYRDSWKGLITPDAFAHPAKFSRSLIHRIYAHAVEERWLQPGSTVIDPFGGVALGGLEAAWHGAHWVGCELEQKFVDLGRSNIALWETRFGHMSTWGSVRLVQGDSRRLGNVLERAGLCVSSPPYAQSLERPNGIDADKIQRPGGSNSQSVTDPRYGSTDGQLGAMRDRGPSLVVGSPPFNDTQCHDPKYKDAGEGHGARHGDYGTSAGQLGAMVVSSPPYWETGVANAKGGQQVDPALIAESLRRKANGQKGVDLRKTVQGDQTKQYGQTEGQLGSAGDDFWTAAREIVSQTYTVLAPNSHAIWVLKGFIRKKTYVDFPDQWRQLCEACGFTTLHWHRCWLVEPGNVQGGLLGEGKDYTRERKSFFRRLAEKKGSPKIDYEVVVCMLKK